MGAEPTADEVFQLLSDKIRLDVLRTVAVAQSENKRTGVAALSFSEIYDRVAVDDTSKLSYHLGELTGIFLRKHDDGYAFTHAGEQMVRFVLAVLVGGGVLVIFSIPMLPIGIYPVQTGFAIGILGGLFLLPAVVSHY